MTVEELQQLIDQVELRNPPFPIRLSSKIASFDVRLLEGRIECAIIMYEMDVRHRDTGEPYTSTGEMALQEGTGRDDAVAKLYEFIEKSCFCHEAAEAFHVGGERVYDPHV